MLLVINLTSYCWCINDIGIAHIANGCKMLQCLDLEHCVKVGDIGICQIATKCQYLRRLNMQCIFIRMEVFQVFQQ